MTYEAYIGYVDGRDQEIDAGEPIKLVVRNLDTFERLVVSAIIVRPGKTLEGSEDLKILDWVEKLLDETWSIKVLEELDEEDAPMRSDITQDDLEAGLNESQKYSSGRGARGAGMPQMMGQEEARKYFENISKKKK